MWNGSAAACGNRGGFVVITEQSLNCKATHEFQRRHYNSCFKPDRNVDQLSGSALSAKQCGCKHGCELVMLYIDEGLWLLIDMKVWYAEQLSS